MAIKREKGGRWSEVGVPPRSLQEKLIGQLQRDATFPTGLFHYRNL